MGTEAKQNEGGTSKELNKVAREEYEFVQRTLKEELGHQPTEDEINEWLREHTESY